MSEHTPLPWSTSATVHWISGPNGEPIAEMIGRRPREADAALILKAVNNYDALVKALYDALAYIDLHQEVCQFDPREITAARDVLESCAVGGPGQ